MSGWLSLRQAGNIKKCLKFSKDVNIHIFMIIHSSVFSKMLQIFKSLVFVRMHLKKVYLALWESTAFCVNGTCGGRESCVVGSLAHLFVPSPSMAPALHERSVHWPSKAVLLAWLLNS